MIDRFSLSFICLWLLLAELRRGRVDTTWELWHETVEMLSLHCISAYRAERENFWASGCLPDFCFAYTSGEMAFVRVFIHMWNYRQRSSQWELQPTFTVVQGPCFSYQYWHNTAYKIIHKMWKHAWCQKKKPSQICLLLFLNKTYSTTVRTTS